MSACAACGRPVALAGATCLYCGAALPEEAAAAAVRARSAALAPQAAAAAGPERGLIVLELRGQDAAALAGALRLTPYEARQRLAGAWPQLWRIAPEPEARAEAERLRAAGLAVATLPEREVREALPPERAEGGALEAGRLRLRLGRGQETVAPDDVLLVVHGPIAREYQHEPEQSTGGIRQARLSAVGRLGATKPTPGYRFQLHRRGGARILELDPATFEFEDRQAGRAAELELSRFVAALAPPERQDDGFRRLAPALSPAEPEPARVARWDGALRRAESGRDETRVLLDNLAQFRFYSAWRGLLERRRGS